MWTAMGAIATFLVCIISVHQANKFRTDDVINRNTVILVPEKEAYESGYFSRYNCSTEFTPTKIENLVYCYSKAAKKHMLTTAFEYRSVSDNIPDKIKIANVYLSYEPNGDNIVEGDVTTGVAVVVNKENPFKVFLTIADDRIDLNRDEYWVGYQLTLIKETEIGEVAVDYSCLSHFTILKKEASYFKYPVKANSILTHQLRKGYKYKEAPTNDNT